MGLPWVRGEGTKPRQMAKGKKRIISTLVIPISHCPGRAPACPESKSIGLQLDQNSYLLPPLTNKRAEANQLTITKS